MINITDGNIETSGTIIDNGGTVDTSGGIGGIDGEIGVIPGLPSDSVIESDHTPHNMQELLPAYLTEGNYNVVDTGNTHIFYTGTKGKIGGTNII